MRLLSILYFFFCAVYVQAEIRLPDILSDGIVLQCETEFTIYGWASPGEIVTLTFKGEKFNAITGKDRKWNVDLPAQEAGGPFEMVFRGENEIRIRNFLFGDVWICSGQSNMVLPMERVKERYPDEIAGADYPEIRNFFIPTKTNLNGPVEDLAPGTWKETNPEDVLTFGAVAYFFAKKIYSEFQVPIGLINASVGGTPIEARISEDGFTDFPEILKTIEQNKDSGYIDSLRKQQGTSRPRQSAEKGLRENPKRFEY